MELLYCLLTLRISNLCKIFLFTYIRLIQLHTSLSICENHQKPTSKLSNPEIDSVNTQLYIYKSSETDDLFSSSFYEILMLIKMKIEFCVFENPLVKTFWIDS